ncbi:hypothetical protein AGMMS49944_31690 [Spirochaetia bacterium]|nr:hypothetical protein AGMMS49944_31690 [Spirochaetia bacterium]
MQRRLVFRNNREASPFFKEKVIRMIIIHHGYFPQQQFSVIAPKLMEHSLEHSNSKFA